MRAIVKRGEFIEDQIKKINEFEFFCKPRMGLVTFKLKPLSNDMTIEKQNEMNYALYEKLRTNTETGYITSSIVKGIRFFRLVSGSPFTTEEHILNFIKYIKDSIPEIVRNYN